MMNLSVEHLDTLTVIECQGRIVQSDDVFRLRDVVTAQAASRIIALDLSEVKAIGGGGLGMLAFLQRWADERRIQLKLFSPSASVMQELERTRSAISFDVATLHEMIGMLADADRHEKMAA